MIKVLSICSTLLDNNSASGNFKINLFQTNENISYKFLSIKKIKYKKFFVLQTSQTNEKIYFLNSVYKELTKNRPNLILLRIDFDQKKLMNFFVKFFNYTKIPYVLIIYDSWFNLELKNSEKILFQQLLFHSSLIITEIDDLSKELKSKYSFNCEIIEIRNSWYLEHFHKKLNTDRKKIIFSGNINTLINNESLTVFSNVIEKFNGEITLDIYKNKKTSIVDESLTRLKYVSIKDQVPYENYFLNLRKYDYGFVPYNFDKESLLYSQNSFSNKLHQYLYNGLTPIGFGPYNQSTIKFLLNYGFKNIIIENNEDEIYKSLSRLSLDSNKKIQNVLKESFDLKFMQDSLYNKFLKILTVDKNLEKIYFKKI